MKRLRLGAESRVARGNLARELPQNPGFRDGDMSIHTMPTWEEGDVIVDPTAPLRVSIAGLLSLGWLRMGVKADVVLALPRAMTSFEDLRFDTADDLETLDEFDIDESDISGTAGER
jgi:hypothetical protein